MFEITPSLQCAWLSLEALVQQSSTAVPAHPRIVLGLVGAPGAGKSSLAAWIQRRWPTPSVVVPMDGFHLAQSELERLGRAQRKGAPDTFDAEGYVALLQRLRREPASTVYAPRFDRRLEEPIAGAIAVAPHHRLVITEGNYLLLDEAPWGAVEAQLSQTWYVQADEPLRMERLLQRHVSFGRTPSAAQAWVATSDEPNARRIERTRARADWVVDLVATGPDSNVG